MNPLAFVDIETTGSHFERDRITEIAIISFQNGQTTRFETLLDPEVYIPSGITVLTGISPQMVQGQPTFEERAQELFQELEDKIFIAHNARFDYGFLKAAFKRVGLDFKPKVICTVKLSRLLFPEQKRHNLDTIIQTHGFTCASRHRAMGDADILLQFWMLCAERFGSETLQASVAKLLKQTSIPANIDESLVRSIPDTPGVYIFYADHQEYLYIGKSKTLRTRVMSHFQQALTQRKEAKMSLRVKHIEWVQTSGELGALLLESKLVKEHLPTMNVRLRRTTELCAWKLKSNHLGYSVPSLISKHDLVPGAQKDIYGPFRGKREAVEVLKKLAKNHNLCEAILALEKISPGKPCFGYQLKTCNGACIGLEKPALHNLKLTSALKQMELTIWPYEGAIGIKEGDGCHLFDKWIYMGFACDPQSVEDLLNNSLPEFDLDIYKIIKTFLRKTSKSNILNFTNAKLTPTAY